jgi:phage tail sheath gpL-like
MTIAFNQVPANLRVPFLYAEFDNSNAVSGPQTQPYNVLMIGPRLSSGTKLQKTKHLITSAAQAAEYFGVGSLLAEMAAKYLAANKTNELHCVALDDDGAGVAATGAIELTGAPTAAGVLSVYIAGRVAKIAVASGATLASLATALQAVLAADTSMLVSAVVDGVNTAKINLTAKNDGTPGNQIDIRLNYFDGDELPAGLGVTITAMASGASNPSVADVFSILDETQYIQIVSAFDDAANMTLIEAELADRFGPIKQNDGYCHYGSKGSVSTLNAKGDSRNSQFTIIHRASGPTHPASQVAAKVGVISASAQIDPARPFQTLAVPGILPESDDEKLQLEERNILLYHGISTDKVVGTQVVLERVITTYKKNNAGADDVSYLDLNTLLTLSYLRYDWRNYMLRKYPRHKLAGDGNRFAAGQPIMTPKLGKAEAIAKFREWQFIGLVEGLDQFKEGLIVERNVSDVNRLDFLLPPDLVNQLMVIGTKFGFLL